MKFKILILSLLVAFTIPVFGQDADMSLIPYRQGDKWGFAGTDRVIVIKPEYEEVGFFYAGYAVAKKGGKYGYINKKGKVVIPFKFFNAKQFRYGYFPKGKDDKIETADDLETNERVVLFAGASLRADGYEICINEKGATMPKCPAIPENSAPDVNKKTTVTVVSNYSTIQKSDLFDKIISDYKMPGAEDSYYIATRGDKYGVFNKTFEVIVPFEYSKIEKIDLGVMPYIMVEKDGLNNYLIFTKDGKTGIKNTRYQVVVEPLYSDIVYDANGGFVLTMNSNFKGFYFLNGNIVEAKYADVNAVKGGEYVMIETQTGKKGYLNNNMVEFFEE